MAAELGPGSISPWAATGAKVTDALASALPLSVTRPETGAVVVDEQPARNAQASGSIRSVRLRVMEGLGRGAGPGRGPAGGRLIGVRDLTAGDRAHRREDAVDIDTRADGANRPVAHDEVDAPSGMQASPPAFAHVRPAQPTD